MGLRIQERGEVLKGVPLVQPGDHLFWFNRPRLLLCLINFVLFQNAFQLAFLAWTWVSREFNILYMRFTYFYMKSATISSSSNFSVRIRAGVLFPWTDRGLGDQDRNGVSFTSSLRMLSVEFQGIRSSFCGWIPSLQGLDSDTLQLCHPSSLCPRDTGKKLLLNLQISVVSCSVSTWHSRYVQFYICEYTDGLDYETNNIHRESGSGTPELAPDCKEEHQAEQELCHTDVESANDPIPPHVTDAPPPALPEWDDWQPPYISEEVQLGYRPVGDWFTISMSPSLPSSWWRLLFLPPQPLRWPPAPARDGTQRCFCWEGGGSGAESNPSGTGFSTTE